MYCKSCKNQVPDGISYCPHCGEKGDFLTSKGSLETTVIVKKTVQDALVEEVEEKTVAVMAKKPVKSVRWAMALIVAIIIVFAGYLLLTNLTPSSKGDPIGFYSEEKGVFFMESGSDKIYDGMTNLDLYGLETNTQFYQKDNDLYQVNYYQRDTMIARNIERLFEPNIYSNSVVYQKDKDYYVYNGEGTTKLNFDGYVVNDIIYFAKTESIGVVTLETPEIYHLYLYDGEVLRWIDSSKVPIKYVKYYNDYCYYVVQNDMHQYKYYDGESTNLLIENESKGLISTMVGMGLSLAGNDEDQLWYLFKDNKLVYVFEDYIRALLNGKSGNSVSISVTDEAGSYMYKIDQNLSVEEVKDVFGQMAQETEVEINSKSGDSQIYSMSEFLIQWVQSLDGEIPTSTNYDISGFGNLTYDDNLSTLYYIDEYDNLVSFELESGLIEIIQSDIISFQSFSSGIVYTSSSDGHIYFKEVGHEAVLLVESGLEAAYYPNIISYDGIHIYMQVVDLLSSSGNKGDIYYFDTESYRLTKICENGQMYYIYTDGTSEFSVGRSLSEF